MGRKASVCHGKKSPDTKVVYKVTDFSRTRVLGVGIVQDTFDTVRAQVLRWQLLLAYMIYYLCIMIPFRAGEIINRPILIFSLGL